MYLSLCRCVSVDARVSQSGSAAAAGTHTHTHTARARTQASLKHAHTLLEQLDPHWIVTDTCFIYYQLTVIACDKAHSTRFSSYASTLSLYFGDFKCLYFFMRVTFTLHNIRNKKIQRPMKHYVILIWLIKCFCFFPWHRSNHFIYVFVYMHLFLFSSFFYITVVRCICSY